MDQTESQHLTGSMQKSGTASREWLWHLTVYQVGYEWGKKKKGETKVQPQQNYNHEDFVNSTWKLEDGLDQTQYSPMVE